MRKSLRPIVLVHGLWNTSKIFDPLIEVLHQYANKIYAPDIDHNLGKTSIIKQARSLNKFILANLGQSEFIDILGFSMGGLIARFWLQRMGGYSRTARFITVGTPHNGTFSASIIPGCLFTGISQMRPNSSFLNDLNRDYSQLIDVECISLYTKYDLMVFPGWGAKMPNGISYSIPVLNHRALITNSLPIMKIKDQLIMT